MRVAHEVGLYHFFMTHLRSSVTSRTLTVVLSESDWQALRAVEPDAVGWLQERIRERLGATESKQASAPPSKSSLSGSAWGDDED
jgi:hypothetical protein